MRRHVILAVFKRNVQSYFSGVLGYLFIVVFVVAGAFAAFSPQFFANNLANLNQLNVYFPYLLLFIIPAITMGVWADEKKLGTDELLFTLPARDSEILLGKYLSVLAVYSVVLAFSVTYLFLLSWLGDPDWGQLLATYFGYWLAGAALLSAGMFASSLTSSTTVAFVLGAVICAVPVFLGAYGDSPIRLRLLRFLGDGLAYIGFGFGFLEKLSLAEQLSDFGMGIVSLTGVLYFASLTAFMLYLNYVVITRRHWSAGQQRNMGLQYAVRVVSLAAVLIGLNSLAGHASLRMDMTAEKLYSLSPTTRALLAKVEDENPIEIHAYISPQVPPEYVPVRERLLGLLRQYDQIGGGGVELRVVNVEPYSNEAEEAKLVGVESRTVQSERGGKVYVEPIYLGVVVRSPFDEVVVPFFDPGLPAEYELTRSIGTVSNEERLTLGVLRTDAQVMGGFNTSAFHSLPEWRIVSELKKQYNVEEVSPDAPIDDKKFDVLLAVLPSSLTQPQMQNFVDYVRQGRPVLIFDDPIPYAAGLQLAPRQPRPRPGGPFGGGGAPPEPKADGGRATSLLSALGIHWDNGEVVWDSTNPHPEFADLHYTRQGFIYVFITPHGGSARAFNPDSEITSGLQELLAVAPGTIEKRPGSRTKFVPLVETSEKSGLLDWNEAVDSAGGFLGMLRVRGEPPRRTDPHTHVLAAHVTAEGDDPGVNAIFVADTDVVSDHMFRFRESGARRDQRSAPLQFDNVTFVLNAVDVLAGDDTYLELRKRRARHRTLEQVKARTDEFVKQRNREQEDAVKRAKDQLDERRREFQKQREQIENDTGLSPLEKRQRLAMIAQTEERKLEVAEANIEQEKQERIEAAKAQTQRQIRETEDWIRFRAIIMPPLPAIILGLFVLSVRLYNERRSIAPDRLVGR